MAKIKSFYYFWKGKKLYYLGYYQEALNAFEEAEKFKSSGSIDHYKFKASKHINLSKSNIYREQNKILSEQIKEMQGQFETLQKQMSILKHNNGNNYKLKNAVKAFKKQEKNKKVKDSIEKLEDRVITLEQITPQSPSLCDPSSQQFFSNQFTKIQNQVTKLQTQISDLKEDNNISQKNILQKQIYDLENNNIITLGQIVKLQGQIEENEKTIQIDRDQLKKNTEQLEEYYLVLQNINAIDKASIKKHIYYLKSKEPLLYIYYKTFYWTISDFFNAQLVLSTDLFTHNMDYTTTKNEYLFKNVKTTISSINIITKHIPTIGTVTEIINDIVDKIYSHNQAQHFKDNTYIISNIVKAKFNNIEELELALTHSSLYITYNRKETILSLKSDLDNSTAKVGTGLLSKIKKMINSDENIKFTDNALIKLAIQDTILLIVKLYENHNFIINDNKNFSDQIRIIFEENNSSSLINNISKYCSNLDNTPALKTLGNAIAHIEEGNFQENSSTTNT